MSAKKIQRPLSAPRAAGEKARQIADDVAAMTPDERAKELEHIGRQLEEHAPTLEAAGSDLLKALNLIAAEFVRAYYPDATHATVHVSKYPASGMPVYSVSLPIACPAGRTPAEPD